MIHSDLLKKIKKDRRHGQFIYPYYGRYSLAEVAPTILSLLGGKTNRQLLPDELYKKSSAGCSKVLMFLTDGVGFDAFFNPSSLQPLFQHLISKADVFPITSTFPSTTAAGLTTIHTGLTPQEHGLPEWVLYLHEVDRVVESLPFKTLDGVIGEDVETLGGTADMLYRGLTIHEQLQRAGVSSFVFLNKLYVDGLYSRATLRGATIVPFERHSDLIVKLRSHISKLHAKAFFYVYWPEVDSISHRFGPHGDEYTTESSIFSHLMMNEFFSKVPTRGAEDTLFLLTADHGQIRVRPDEIIRLNNHAVLRNLQERPDGSPIPPIGSPKDVFLHVKPELLHETISLLRDEFHGRAEVVRIEDAIQRGLFGLNKVSDRFRKRVGNALIIPNPNTMIWYEYNEQDPFAFLGHHGGLSEQEMIIPLVVAELKDLLV